MGIYGAPSPKASWLLGSPYEAQQSSFFPQHQQQHIINVCMHAATKSWGVGFIDYRDLCQSQRRPCWHAMVLTVKSRWWTSIQIVLAPNECGELKLMHLLQFTSNKTESRLQPRINNKHATWWEWGVVDHHCQHQLTIRKGLPISYVIDTLKIGLPGLQLWWPSSNVDIAYMLSSS